MNGRTLFLRSIAIVSLVSLIGVPGFADESDFKAPPSHVGPPLASHEVSDRRFQGIPSMAVTSTGHLWATWYAGSTPGEDHNNYVVLSTSKDNGTSWREVLIIDPDADGPVRAYDPELWFAPNGTLRLAWAQTIGHEGSVAGVWFLETTEPELECPQWKDPVRITDGIMMCKPTVLSSGEWALPASTWRKTDYSAKMVVSADQGKTWAIRGGCNVPPAHRAFDEHMLIERQDGSLWLLARTNYGIGESVSVDHGVTWPELKPSSIAHPSARFFIRRLNSGNLLLVKHGPVTSRTGRSHLTAFVSTDDGTTWTGGLILDERDGVSYPDGQQAADGLIRIVYDYSRTGARHILMATFREEDVTAGTAVSNDVRRRQLVSNASAVAPPDRKNDNVKSGFVKTTLELADSGRMNCHLRQGTEPTLVLIPGTWGGFWRFESLIAALPPEIGIAVVELPWQAGNKPPSLELSMEQIADDVLQAIEAMELQRFVVAGHSIGGMIAVEIAGRDVRGLVGAIPMEGWTHHTVVQTAFDGTAVSNLTAEEEAHHQADRQRGRRHLSEKELQAIATIWRQWDGSRCLERSTIPILEIWGDRGKTRPNRKALRLPARDNIELSWIADASHLILLEDPDLVARVVLEFLKKLK